MYLPVKLQMLGILHRRARVQARRHKTLSRTKSHWLHSVALSFLFHSAELVIILMSLMNHSRFLLRKPWWPWWPLSWDFLSLIHTVSHNFFQILSRCHTQIVWVFHFMDARKRWLSRSKMLLCRNVYSSKRENMKMQHVAQGYFVQRANRLTYGMWRYIMVKSIRTDGMRRGSHSFVHGAHCFTITLWRWDVTLLIKLFTLVSFWNKSPTANKKLSRIFHNVTVILNVYCLSRMFTQGQTNIQIHFSWRLSEGITSHGRPGLRLFFEFPVSPWKRKLVVITPV